MDGVRAWQRLVGVVRAAAGPRGTSDGAGLDGGTGRDGGAGRAGGGPTGAWDAPIPSDVRITYAPRDDDAPDPGEVVWAWVPFEEGDGRGKDRPVLVVARHGRDLLALMMTSRDHDGDEAPDHLDDLRGAHRLGRPLWVDVGAGGWDARRRPSEVRLDRVLTVSPDDVRREGARLDAARFEHVAHALRELHGWR